MNQLTVVNSRELLSPSDTENLRKNKWRGFTDDEVAYCGKICTALQLNPFLNQIHFVKRKNKDGGYTITAQVGIDGYRLSAQRAGAYAGSDEPIFEYAPSDAVRKKPAKATVAVYKVVSGIRCSFTASARWDEYYPGPSQGLWDRMPHNQLAKCAEALALRKAFPAELGSLRLDEEMDQADRPQKGQSIQDKLREGEEEPPIEAESRPVEGAESEELPPCSHCQSQNVMESRYQAGAFYCKDCKKAFAPKVAV